MTAKIQDIEQLDFIKRKKYFLEKHKSPSGKTKYKRYLGSTLRYAGGKSLAVGLIVELLPDNIKKVVSPFFGGGSVEIALAKELGLEVKGYDIFDLLVNYWNIQFTKPESLARKLEKFEPTKEEYKKIKEILKAHWNKESKIKSKLDLAAIYYYNHNTSYGPHFLGHPSSVYLQEKRYKKTIEKVKNFNAGNISIECKPFLDIMEKHSEDFLYCDPPYYLEGDSKTFVGMYPHRNFPIHHNGFKHEELRDFLKAHKGGFILSYNDCSTIREWYKDFEFSTPKWQYTFSQGDTRIGKNRTENNEGSHVKKSHEILIWKMPDERKKE